MAMAMANRRCLQRVICQSQCLKGLSTVSRYRFTSSASALHEPPALKRFVEYPVAFGVRPYSFLFNQHFCSRSHDDDDDDEDDEDDGSSEGEVSQDEDEGPALSPEGKEEEAAEIGYRVIGPLGESDRVFRRYQPVFAVVQIGSHQFKVSNGDCIYTEKLKHCDINDKLLLNKILILGSKTQTIIGRPLLSDAAVHAVVEEHALDAKVIVFKKKRRKNYRRTKGHRQELTKLRITSILGIQVPISDTPSRSEKKQKPEALLRLKTQKKDGLEALPVAASA